MHLFRQFIGPALTLFVVLFIHFASPFISVSFGFALVALTWTAYISGPIPTTISGIIIATFMLALYPPDYGRLIQGILTVILTGSMVIILKHKARMTETLNGNINRLREALGITRELLNVWGDFSDQGKFKRVRDIEDKLGNLAALVYGWHKIRQEIEETKAELGSNGIKQPPTDINTINKP